MSQNRMDDKARLRILIDHWMEHNAEHAQEFSAWAVKTEQPEVRRQIEEAARQMEKANDHLLAALQSLKEE